jgi:hypothetical protein
MQHRFVMASFNQIIAPVIASFLTNQACFFYALYPTDPISSSMQFNGYIFARNEYVQYSLSIFTSFRPPFIYSSNCGSSLLATYIPVMMYSYIGKWHTLTI